MNETEAKVVSRAVGLALAVVVTLLVAVAGLPADPARIVCEIHTAVVCP